MGNINMSLDGYPGLVVERMIKAGFARTKGEALRLALYEFGQKHNVIPDEDEVFEEFAKKAIADIKSGKIKTRKFDIDELD